MLADFSTLLDRYLYRFREESSRVDRFFELLNLKDAFVRTGRPGHFTASALILDPNGIQTLLVKHRKLGIWVQPGGHADNERNLIMVARREVREETGLTDCLCDGEILDLDIHAISEYDGESAHHHYDVRFLFIANPEEKLYISQESTDLQWIKISSINHFTQEESFLRMLQKVKDRLPEQKKN